MPIPVLDKVSFDEFQVADNVYKIIHEDSADRYVSLDHQNNASRSDILMSGVAIGKPRSDNGRH